MKKISVIVTCFNLEKYLDECIDSIKQQILQPFEIILIHDGCKAGSKAYQGITTIFSDKNYGVSEARDKGFRISKGDYIVFFDGDDVMPLNYLMQMSYTEADVVYPSCVVWAGWGDSGHKNVWHEAPNHIKFHELLIKNEVLMPSLIKREWYKKVGGFDAELPLFEDWAFFVKIMSKGAIFKKSCAFIYYRQRTQSRNHQKDEIKKEVYRKVRAKYPKFDKRGRKLKKVTRKPRKSSKV